MKLKRVDETSVYISQGGYLAIKQINSVLEAEEVVLLSPEYAEKVIAEMSRLLKYKDEWWNVEEDDSEE